MSRFIWIKDRDGREHYVNVKHIIRVTKVPAGSGTLKSPGYAYVVTDERAEFTLSNDKGYDTYEDIIAKIQAAMA